jgi:hypothetical protein
MLPAGEELLSQRRWGDGEPTLDQHFSQRRPASRAELDQDRGVPLEVRDGEDAGESGGCGIPESANCVGTTGHTRAWIDVRTSSLADKPLVVHRASLPKVKARKKRG